MINLFGKLLTAYAFATLNGAGLIVIFFAGSCWYVQGNYGWIALGVYLLIWWGIVELLIRALANWINKNSVLYGNKAIEPIIREKKARVRATRHGY